MADGAKYRVRARYQIAVRRTMTGIAYLKKNGGVNGRAPDRSARKGSFCVKSTGQRRFATSL
jgi:hypothetical protein